MPEVRHGSNLTKVQSDPGLPSDSHPAAASSGSLDAPPPVRPLQQSQTQSADHVPVVKHNSQSSWLGRGLRRGDSDNTNSHTNNSGSAANTVTMESLPRPSAVSLPNNRRRNSLFLSSPIDPAPRRSLSYALRPQAEAYYDSRAGTKKEWKRRAKTLEDYYEEHPDLLPQLPFTWHHGKRRWRLWFFAFIVFVDASAIPIALYYGMKYAGHVEEYIIFIIVTTIWGGPTYLEFGLRTLRLIKKEHFFRPLGTTSRWCADMLTWASSLAIFVLTTLFIVGSAPHDTWLRVVAMAAPSILWTLGGVLLLITLYHRFNWPAPFRISSTAKGEKVSQTEMSS